MADTLKAPARNPLLSGQAELAKKIKAFLNKYETKKLGKIDSPWNRYGAGHELGSLLFGESPELLDDMSYEGIKALVSGHSGRIPIPDKRLLDMPIPTPSAGGLGVIKNKGGNWLTGSVENVLKGLKKDVPTFDPNAPSISQSVGNYIRTNFPDAQRSYEDAFTRSGEHSMYYAKNFLPWLKQNRPDVIESLVNNTSPNARINQWIEGPLTNYIKNSMATPEDPIRLRADRLAKAAEDRLFRETEKIQSKYPVGDVRYNNSLKRAQERYEDEMSGILHYEPRYIGVSKEARTIAGFPEEGYARTDLGKLWEDATDDRVLSVTKGVRNAKTDYFARVYPEFTNLADDTPIYQPYISRLSRQSGLDHLIDEIGNAINPTSDLPANLRLTPEDLANPFKNSMEAMVDKVAKINQHRRRMAIEAEKKSNKAIRDYPDWNVVKEYPDGYKMVRLPDVADNPEAFKIGKACGEKGGWCTQGEDMLQNYGSGDSRLNLLLDPDGKPVAQIETVKPEELSPYLYLRNNNPETAQRIDDEFEQYYERIKESGKKYSVDYRNELKDIWSSQTPEYLSHLQEPQKYDIYQIKGKYNAKPKAEHIPYLQDFVKSGNFSDVRELENVDMENINDYRDSVIKRVREAGLTGDYFTPDEIYQYLDPGI